MSDEMVEKALAAWNAKSNEIDSLSKPIRWPADFTMAQRGQARDCMRAALAAAEAGEPVASWECFRDEAFFDMWCVRPKGERRFGHSFHVTTEEEAEGLVALLSASPPSEASRDERVAIRKEALEEAADMAEAWASERGDGFMSLATAIRARGET